MRLLRRYWTELHALPPAKNHHFILHAPTLAFFAKFIGSITGVNAISLWPVHTGDYSGRIRRLSRKPATVAEFGDSRRFSR